jgi:aspartate carbamoyltransferase catalytic subunit
LDFSSEAFNVFYEDAERTRLAFEDAPARLNNHIVARLVSFLSVPSGFLVAAALRILPELSWIC